MTIKQRKEYARTMIKNIRNLDNPRTKRKDVCAIVKKIADTNKAEILKGGRDAGLYKNAVSEAIFENFYKLSIKRYPKYSTDDVLIPLVIIGLKFMALDPYAYVSGPGLKLLYEFMKFGKRINGSRGLFIETTINKIFGVEDIDSYVFDIRYSNINNMSQPTMLQALIMIGATSQIRLGEKQLSDDERKLLTKNVQWVQYALCRIRWWDDFC